MKPFYARDNDKAEMLSLEWGGKIMLLPYIHLVSVLCKDDTVIASYSFGELSLRLRGEEQETKDLVNFCGAFQTRTVSRLFEVDGLTIKFCLVTAEGEKKEIR